MKTAGRIRWIPLLWIVALMGSLGFLIVYHLPKEIDRRYPGIVYEPESQKMFVEAAYLRGRSIVVCSAGAHSWVRSVSAS